MLSRAACRLRTGVLHLQNPSNMHYHAKFPIMTLECKPVRINTLPDRLFVRGLATQGGDSSTSKDKDAKQNNTILTEYVSGRTRIFTSMPTGVGSGRGSKQCISSPLTSPLSWQWLQPQAGQMGPKNSKWGHRRQRILSLGVLNSLQQSMRQMFLPVG
jgi:hypothetical protein